MKRLLLLLLTLAPCLAIGQLTYVPDDNFENYLENNGMGDGIANNDSVLTANISGVDSLNVIGKSISDLTGIEDFTALSVLECDVNQLTSLDVSNNTALTNLDCSYNQLTSLDVSNNTALTRLRCSNNQLVSLNLGNVDLVDLFCQYNSLTSLDLSQNTKLYYVWCHYNQFTTLDVSNCTSLSEFSCSDNQLTSLDIRNGNNANMEDLFFYNNPNLYCIDVDLVSLFTNTFTVANGNH